jgi:beta-glucosidase
MVSQIDIEALLGSLSLEELEMPGPGRHRNVSAVMEDIDKGRVSESTIDERVRALLRFLERVGAF